VEILVLNGPNLDLLGTREPEKYGRRTLAEIGAALDAVAGGLGVRLRHEQHNDEGALIASIRRARADGLAGIVVNAAGYTHTSVVLRDALVASDLPFVEIHISNVHAREPFRHHSYLSDVAAGVIVGCGPAGYGLALRALVARLRAEDLPS
jgi:3-dehydroquinate dehydratase-2